MYDLMDSGSEMQLDSNQCNAFTLPIKPSSSIIMGIIIKIMMLILIKTMMMMIIILLITIIIIIITITIIVKVISIHKLGDVGISSNLIDLLSLFNGQCPAMASVNFGFSCRYVYFS